MICWWVYNGFAWCWLQCVMGEGCGMGSLVEDGHGYQIWSENFVLDIDRAILSSLGCGCMGSRDVVLNYLGWGTTFSTLSL